MEGNYYKNKYGKIELTALHPYYECIECRHRDNGELICPCTVIQEIEVSDDHIRQIRLQTN